MRLKTFFITLFTFLIFLYGGVAFFLTMSLKSSIQNIKDRAIGEHYFIVSAFYNDYISIQSRKSEEQDRIAESLFDSYSAYYQKQPVSLAVYQQNMPLKSTLPDIEISFDEKAVPDQRKVYFQSDEDKEYLLVTGEVPEPFDDYLVVYCYDLTREMNRWSRIARELFRASFVLSLLLGVILYVVLYCIFKPLTQIADAAEKVAGGDYDNKISIRGKGEIGRVADSFNHMVEEIKASVNELSETAKQKQEFIDNFAHELRTPLTSIYGYAEYLQKAKLTEEDTYESTQFIMSESQRLQRLGDRLLQLALYREQELRLTQVSLPDLFHSLEVYFKIKLAKKNIALKIQTAQCCVRGDETLLECLFSNIIENAMKACDRDGEIAIKALQGENESVVVTIADNGKGIPDDAIQHITEAFYRADKSRSKAEGGAGIGLALCKQIVDRHHGLLEFHSGGRGTTVTITFTS